MRKKEATPAAVSLFQSGGTATATAAEAHERPSLSTCTRTELTACVRGLDGFAFRTTDC